MLREVLPPVETCSTGETDTGFMRTVVTDETGTYLMPNLPTGPYRLEMSDGRVESRSRSGPLRRRREPIGWDVDVRLHLAQVKI